MLNKESRSRREFILTALPATLCMVAIPGDLMAYPLLSASREGAGGTYTLNLNDHPALQQVNGSVRITIPSLWFKILVTRVSQTELIAVSEICTHHGCAIGDLDVATERFTCPCHFSQYAPDGRVLKGPAIRNLERFPVLWDGGELAFIEIGELASVMVEQPDHSSLSPISSASSLITLEYRVERPAHLQLTIHTIAGEEVLRVIDQHAEAGSYSETVDISMLPQGVFFCRMQTSDGYVGVEKFMHQ